MIVSSSTSVHMPQWSNSRIPEQEVTCHQHISDIQLIPLLARRKVFSQRRRLDILPILFHILILLLSYLDKLDDTFDLLCVDRSESLVNVSAGFIVARAGAWRFLSLGFIS